MEVQKAYAPIIAKRLAKGDGQAAAEAGVALHRTHAENLIRLLDMRRRTRRHDRFQKDTTARRAGLSGRTRQPRSN